MRPSTRVWVRFWLRREFGARNFGARESEVRPRAPQHLVALVHPRPSVSLAQMLALLYSLACRIARVFVDILYIIISTPSTEEDDLCTLWCLINGPSHIGPFKVVTSMQSDIDDLKRLVLTAGFGARSTVVASNLTLFKVTIWNHCGCNRSLRRTQVDVRFNTQTTRDSLRNVSVQKNDELMAWKSIRHYWSVQPARDRLHIMVKRPLHIGMPEIGRLCSMLLTIDAHDVSFFFRNPPPHLHAASMPDHEPAT